MRFVPKETFLDNVWPYILTLMVLAIVAMGVRIV